MAEKSLKSFRKARELKEDIALCLGITDLPSIVKVDDAGAGQGYLATVRISQKQIDELHHRRVRELMAREDRETG